MIQMHSGEKHTRNQILVQPTDSWTIGPLTSVTIFNLSISKFYMIIPLSILLLWDTHFTVGDLGLHFLGVDALAPGAHGLHGAENFLDGAGKGLGHGLVPHLLSNVNDGVNAEGAGVLDILDLLSVSLWLLKSGDDKSGCGWDDGNCGLAIDDGDLNGATESLVWLCNLGNLLTDLTRIDTEWTEPWGKLGSNAGFTTPNTSTDNDFT